MKQETVFEKSNKFEKAPFTLPFLYNTKVGEKINHEFKNGNETYQDTYEVIEILIDVITSTSITRKIRVYLLDTYEV
jgi:hypothetical protein